MPTQRITRMSFIPRELEMVEGEERELQLHLAAAREQARMNEGEVPTEHHELVRRLQAEWKRARDHLDRASHATAD